MGVMKTGPLASPPEFTCMTPAVGSGGTITCTASPLVAGANLNFTLVLKVPDETPPGTTLPTANYCESNAAQCLRPVGDASTTNHGPQPFYGDSGQYSLLRRQTTDQSATIGTIPQDTANNSDDILDGVACAEHQHRFLPYQLPNRNR